MNMMKPRLRVVTSLAGLIFFKLSKAYWTPLRVRSRVAFPYTTLYATLGRYNGFFECSECSRSFGTERSLQQHVNAKHPPRNQCGYCDKSFNTRQALEQHMNAKHPSIVRCPACGETRFRSLTNAIQHLESGACPNCRGKENARGQVHQAIRPHLQQTGQLLLSEGDVARDSSRQQHQLDEFPYKCNRCTRKFRELNHLMQHMSAKHKAPVLGSSSRSNPFLLPP